MFKAPGFGLVSEQFADQFEPDGDGFLYRRYGRDAAIRVTAAERQRCITAFDRYLSFAWLGLIVSTVGTILLIAIYAVTTNREASDLTSYIALGTLLAAFMIATYWARRLATRELGDRPAIAERRSRAEMKQRMLEKLSYGQIAIAGVIGVYCLLRVNYHGDLLSAWNALWLVLGALDLVVCFTQAYRKWRFESAKTQL